MTSLAFALLHPMWSWPAIFVLSIGLGYVFERTGNLVSSLVMHMGFNGLNVLLAVLQLYLARS
jgi:membrane protease YdiL (CAAX protease family)